MIDTVSPVPGETATETVGPTYMWSTILAATIFTANNGDAGTFAAVSGEAQVDEPGAGMSACWLDFDNDGKQDIYAAGMWVAGGMRVFEQSHFHKGRAAEKDSRPLPAAHDGQFVVCRNQGNGTFSKRGDEKQGLKWAAEVVVHRRLGTSTMIHPDTCTLRMGIFLELSSAMSLSFFWQQVVAEVATGLQSFTQIMNSDGAP